MQSATQITEQEYYYALECLPPIYPSQHGEEYIIAFVEFDNEDLAPLSQKIQGIFQSSEPTKHQSFWTNINTFVAKPVYATYFMHNGKYYKYDSDMQNLSLI